MGVIKTEAIQVVADVVDIAFPKGKLIHELNKQWVNKNRSYPSGG